MYSEANDSSNEWEYPPSNSVADPPARISMTENESEDKFCAENSQAPEFTAFSRQQESKRPVLMFPKIVLSRIEVPIVKQSKQINGELLIKCSHLNCMDLFEGVEAMMYHVKTFHAKNIHITFECHICKRTLADRICLQRHMSSVHNGLKPIQECSRKSARTKYVKWHIVSKHNQTRDCELCRRRFKSRKSLAHHSRCFHRVYN